MTYLAGMKTYKAIIQLTSDDPKVHRSMIRQVSNLLAHLGVTVNVRIVCHGSSMPFCTVGNTFAGDISALLNQHVTIAACRNMLVANGVEATDLIEGIEVIPSGIAELVVLQQEGWSYIKAG
ncbi:MAG: DsrE family protein [Dyadobacter sp.]|uniref:DsrE family protein n=1 Tax=Dyadobacter sp. TaxID=1914288 RepID=UPI001B002B5C|nr:DsrE family protein [Dyadobacter sp.]MBO9613550.1 DsrE family protein [Dyadobacter sp.]